MELNLIWDEEKNQFVEKPEPFGAVECETEEDFNTLKTLMDHVPANESKAMFADDEGAFDDRRQFVKNLGFLLSQTREGVTSAELMDTDVVAVRFEDGAVQGVNVKCDSYMAIIRDVAKAIE